MTVVKFPKGGEPKGLRVSMRAADRGEILIYGPIGFVDWDGDGITAKRFADEIKKLANAKTIDVRINSEGGDVFDGKAIYTLLAGHKANIVVHIDGLAASAASYIAMAGNEIRIAEGGFVMIHNAWSFAIGNADDMRRTADLLETVSDTICDVYVARTKKTKKQCKDWMAAETWFTGKEAVANGFADMLVENMRVAASVTRHQFRNTPAVLKPKRSAAHAMLDALRRK
ncbi:head maturation protease, ClpP-related [Mesorhizobium sp. CAU 1741]|uniref:head maturation protease, ClpP-related n=1 Tax=Mesorhizobium sp. CAU 1741 TaxID=3140366 RepID=UPI00325B564D